VRTPEFKEWFGDWEGLRAQKKLDAMEPVELVLSEEYRDADLETLRKEVEKHLDKLAEAGAKAEHPELGQIGFSKSKAKKATSTSAATEKLHAALDIVRVIEVAHHVRSELSSKQGHARQGGTYHTLVAKVSAFECEFVAVLMVEQSSNGRLSHNTIAVDSGHEKAPSISPRNSEFEDSAITSALHEAGESKLPPLRRVNPESVSRAVDPKTCEPSPEAIAEWREQQGEQGGRNDTRARVQGSPKQQGGVEQLGEQQALVEGGVPQSGAAATAQAVGRGRCGRRGSGRRGCQKADKSALLEGDARVLCRMQPEGGRKVPVCRVHLTERRQHTYEFRITTHATHDFRPR